MNITDPRFQDADIAREWLETQRWPDGPVCSHCGSLSATSLRGKAHRPGLDAFQKYNGPGNSLQRDDSRFNDYGGSVGGPGLALALGGGVGAWGLLRPAILPPSRSREVWRLSPEGSDSNAKLRPEALTP